MARLIDADALYEEHTRLAYKGDYAFHITARAWLEKAPTVDAVPVVRCEDCSMCKIVEYYGGGEKRVCRLFDRSMLPDDFCSYGERKGGDNP